MRGIALAAGLCCLVAAASPAHAQTAVTMIVGFPAGGATDLMARTMQPELAIALGTPVVVKNAAGANGTVGALELARSRPDGNTIMLAPVGSLVVTPHTRGAPFQQSDFAPVCQVADAPVVLMTQPDSGLRTLADVVARARANPGGFPYASTGPGGTPHISMISLERQAGIEMNHIPFRGSGEVMQAMAANQIQLFADQGNLVRQYGLRPIAIFSAERAAEFPDTPTMRELGHDIVFTIWSGLYAPAATPAPLLDRLEAACVRMMAAPAVVEGLRRMDMPVRVRGRAAFTAFHNAEYARFGALVQQYNLRAN